MKKLVPYLVVAMAKEENRKIHTKRSLITIERGIPNESRNGRRLDIILILLRFQISHPPKTGSLVLALTMKAFTLSNCAMALAIVLTSRTSSHAVSLLHSYNVYFVTIDMIRTYGRKWWSNRKKSVYFLGDIIFGTSNTSKLFKVLVYMCVSSGIPFALKMIN